MIESKVKPEIDWQAKIDECEKKMLEMQETSVKAI